VCECVYVNSCVCVRERSEAKAVLVATGTVKCMEEMCV